MKGLVWGIGFCGLVIAGCGGGGGGNASSTGGAQEPVGASFEFGSLTGRAATTNPPFTTNSGEVVATGLTGIITLLRLRDQQLEPGEGRILFTSLLGGLTARDVFSCNLDGSDLRRITNTPDLSETYLAISPDGKRIAFASPVSGGDFELFLMNIDGTGREQITNNSGNDILPKWSPSGKKIAYENGGDIHLLDVPTKSISVLLASVFPSNAPAFTPDEQTIVFHSARTGDSLFHLYQIPVTGGSVTTWLSHSGSSQSYPTFAPDGFQAMYFDSANNMRRRTLGGGSSPGPSVDSPDTLHWSPDSRRVLFNRVVDSWNSMFVSDPDGSNASELLPDLEVTKVPGGFVPPPKDVLFVGPGSLFGSRLAGMIFGQKGPSARSLLGFDVVTPSSVVMTKQTPSDTTSPNLVYSIDADTVTEIAYAHAPYWDRIRVVGGGTGVSAADGALVSIDSLSGKIVAVLPFAGVRTSKPTFSDQGSTRVFTGNFLGVFDGSGNNLGPASEVRLVGGALSVEH